MAGFTINVHKSREEHLRRAGSMIEIIGVELVSSHLYLPLWAQERSSSLGRLFAAP